MSEHHFGLGRGKVPAKVRAQVEAIAAAHDATFANPKLPEGYRYWFSCENRGQPFDAATARAVIADLDAAGFDVAKLGGK